VVTLMANLFYYVSLLMEGAHQEKSNGLDNKLKCAELFFSLFLNQGELVKDYAYLALCAAVVAQA